MRFFFSLPVIQLGTFRSPDGEYFVEPLHSYQGEHYEEEHTKPHIVYKKSAPKKNTSGENSACDTSGITRCTHAVYTERVVTNIHKHARVTLMPLHTSVQTQTHPVL